MSTLKGKCRWDGLERKHERQVWDGLDMYGGNVLGRTARKEETVNA